MDIISPRNTASRNPLILIADDDQEDWMLLAEAFKKKQLASNLRFVRDGEELLDYLGHKGRFSDKTKNPSPDLIFLDLDMPKKDGHGALLEIKSHPDHRKIPLIVWTTSSRENDIVESYRLGANCYITKPSTFELLSEVVALVEQYWMQTVALPQCVDCQIR